MRVAPLMLVLVAVCGADVVPAAAQDMPQQQPGVPPLRITPPAPTSGGVFLGGVPSGTPTGEVITIPVIDAIRRALEFNLGVLTADRGITRASAERWRALGDLLPDASGRVGNTLQKINLAAFGFQGGPGSPFGDIPTIIGPFDVFDARLYVEQPVLDISAINNVRSASHNAAAARLTSNNARNFVIHVAGNLYIQALAAAARAEAARAQQDTAQALYQQALDLKNSGLVAGIDVLRAEVALSTETQRATAAANDADKTKLTLARVIGLPLGQPFALDPNLPDLPEPDQTLDQAVEAGYRTRPDFQAALERVRAAELARTAVVSSRLPTVHVHADVGEIGLSPGEAQQTFTLAGFVNIPIFQAGRIQAQLRDADAELRNRRDEAEDLKASIYYEVRTAFMDLQTTRAQLQVATKARDLAAQQLTQARDRFAAGVASNIEVVQAQEAVALATEQYIAAKYGFDLAKGAVIRGTGASEAILRQISGGTR